MHRIGLRFYGDINGNHTASVNSLPSHSHTRRPRFPTEANVLTPEWVNLQRSRSRMQMTNVLT